MWEKAVGGMRIYYTKTLEWVQANATLSNPRLLLFGSPIILSYLE